MKVLDGLIDWHRKTDSLAKVASRNYDALEQYKMMFVQMKQLIKEKDIIVQRMRQQTQIVREKGRDQIENIQRQLVGTN